MVDARAARRLERLTVRVAVSEAARNTAVRVYGPMDISVLWNGVEVDRFASAEPWPTRKPAVLFVGRHEPRKGLSVLLDAWAGIDRDAVLWVAGSGPQTDALRRRNVPGVEWLGPVTDDDRNRRLRAATAFCAPAVRSESFGVVLLEAMAAGAPVVASKIDGYANVARDGREGLLAAPDDPRGAARCAPAGARRCRAARRRSPGPDGGGPTSCRWPGSPRRTPTCTRRP